MSDTLAVLGRLVAATNAHDVDALIDCFATDYVNETPAHPLRGFRGREQVRRNWAMIFAAVPDIVMRVISSAVDGDDIWVELEMVGTRADGAPRTMAGVIIFGVEDGRIASARFYLEPVESETGDVNAAVARLTTEPAS